MAFAILVGPIAVASATREQGVQPPKSPSPLYTLAISSDDTRVKAGSPVFVEVTIAMVEEADLPAWSEVHPGLQPLSINRIEVIDEKGKPAKRTKYYKSTDSGQSEINLIRAAERSVMRGKPISVRLEITQTFELIHPGKYTIRLIPGFGEGIAANGQNTVTVTITP
jgi:hypothetical protein